MNEINIGIPYSLFNEMFYCFVDLHFKTTRSTSKFAINKTKEYWILLDEDSREHIIRLCDSPNNSKLAAAEIKTFKEWAIQNRNAKQDYNTARPPVDVLPVVLNGCLGFI